MLIESFISATQNVNASDNSPRAIYNDIRQDFARISLWAILVGLLLLILIQFVLGPFLWNKVLRKLFPRLGLAQAAWYDVFALHILLALIIPAIQPASWVSNSSSPNIAVPLYR